MVFQERKIVLVIDNQSKNCGEGIKFNLRDNTKQIHQFQSYMIIGTYICIFRLFEKYKELGDFRDINKAFYV